MLRPWLAAALLIVPLAGCFGGPDDTPATTPVPSSATEPTAAPAAPIVRTDTLYLLGPPHLSGTLSTGGEPYRSYVPSDLDHLDAVAPVIPTWSLPRPALAELDVQLRIWIDVQGVVTNPPRGAFNCFWSFDFFVEHLDGTRTGLTSYCRSEAPVLPEGTRLLEQSFVQTPDLGFQPGDRLGFAIGTYGAYAPDATVDVLSGTPEYDSSLTIAGLQLPIDTQTLLL